MHSLANLCGVYKGASPCLHLSLPPPNTHTHTQTCRCPVGLLSLPIWLSILPQACCMPSCSQGRCSSLAPSLKCVLGAGRTRADDIDPGRGQPQNTHITAQHSPPTTLARPLDTVARQGLFCMYTKTALQLVKQSGSEFALWRRCS